MSDPGRPMVSVVVPINSGEVVLEEIVPGYSQPLRDAGYPFEIVLVFDGVGPRLAEQAQAMAERFPLKLLVLHGSGLGESVALTTGVEAAAADLIINAPQYLQTVPEDMIKVVRTLETGADFVATWRHPRVDPWLNRLQSMLFNKVMGVLMGNTFHDLNSGMRGMKRAVLQEVTFYGDMYRFLPVLAQRQGFKVEEVKLRHREERGSKGFYGIGVYTRRALDLAAISFLTRFRERPLRFFGVLGLIAMALGLLMVAEPLWAKLFNPGEGLQDRPIFVVGTILIAFGVQLIGFGLVGEIVIFTQARNMEDYQVDQLLAGTLGTEVEAAAKPEAPAAAVQVRELLPGEDARWDSLVQSHSEGTFFHLSGWRRVVQEVFRHEPLYLIAEQGDAWLGVLPLFRVHSPFVGRSLISVPYAVYGGVLAEDDAVHDALLDAAVARAEEFRLDFVEFRNLQAPRRDLPASDLYVTFRCELPATAAEVMPGLPKKARAEVRRAQDRFELRCEVSDDLGSFYALFVSNKKRLGSPSLPRRWFEHLCEEFGGRVVLHMVREPDGAAIAGVMSFICGDTVYAYYSGALHEKNNTGVNNFIYCRIMEWAVEKGLRYFDFGRSRRESGPAAFKKNMGFETRSLHYQYCLISDSARIPEFHPSNPKLQLPRKIWSHLPPLVARGLSGPLSRYLP